MRTIIKFIFFISLITLGVFYFSNNTAIVAEYSFDKNVFDDSRYKNNGKIIGKVYPAPNRLDRAFSSYYFTGGKGGIVIPSQSQLSIGKKATSFTATLWFNSMDGLEHPQNVILAKGQTINQQLDYALYIDNSISKNPVLFWQSGSSKDSCSKLKIAELTERKWHFIGITLEAKSSNSGIISIFYDGVSKTSCKYAHKFKSNDLPLFVGTILSKNKEYSHFFNGKLDNLTFYNRALSDKELLKIYRNKD